LDVPLLCDGALCNYTTQALAVSAQPHEIQIRTKDIVTGIGGPPALWRWAVAQCDDQQYANITEGGALSCSTCPTGGDCTESNATAHTLVAKPGWWAPPHGPRLTLYRCPFANSCTGGKETVCNESAGFSNSTVCGLCQDNFVSQGDTCAKCPPIEQVTYFAWPGLLLTFPSLRLHSISPLR
jgi:hypothetical protein